MKLSYFINHIISQLVFKDECSNSSPGVQSCSDFQFNDLQLNNQIEKICNNNSVSLSGCSINNKCKQNIGINKNYCHPLSILSNLCIIDKLSTQECEDYNNICNSKSKENQIKLCKQYDSFPQLLSSSELTKNIRSICIQNNQLLEECNSCLNSNNQTIFGCDQLSTYYNLCKNIPYSLECVNYSTVCNDKEINAICKSSSKSILTYNNIINILILLVL